jgi:hypothetical protein
MSSWVGKQHSGSRDASKMAFHFSFPRFENRHNRSVKWRSGWVSNHSFLLKFYVMF